MEDEDPFHLRSHPVMGSSEGGECAHTPQLLPDWQSTSSVDTPSSPSGNCDVPPTTEEEKTEGNEDSRGEKLKRLEDQRQDRIRAIEAQEQAQSKVNPEESLEEENEVRRVRHLLICSPEADSLRCSLRKTN
jgi:hypothetical protein